MCELTAGVVYNIALIHLSIAMAILQLTKVSGRTNTPLVTHTGVGTRRENNLIVNYMWHSIYNRCTQEVFASVAQKHSSKQETAKVMHEYTYYLLIEILWHQRYYVDWIY